MIPRHKIRAHKAELARRFLLDAGPSITSAVARGARLSESQAYDALRHLEAEGMIERKQVKGTRNLPCLLWTLIEEQPEVGGGLVYRALSSRTPIERAWGHIGEHA